MFKIKVLKKVSINGKPVEANYWKIYYRGQKCDLDCGDVIVVKETGDIYCVDHVSCPHTEYEKIFLRYMGGDPGDDRKWDYLPNMARYGKVMANYQQ